MLFLLFTSPTQETLEWVSLFLFIALSQTTQASLLPFLLSQILTPCCAQAPCHSCGCHGKPEVIVSSFLEFLAWQKPDRSSSTAEDSMRWEPLRRGNSLTRRTWKASWRKWHVCSDMGGVGTSQVIGEHSIPTRGTRMCKGQETREREWLLEHLKVQHGMELIAWRLKRSRFQAVDVSLGFLIQLSYLQIGISHLVEDLSFFRKSEGEAMLGDISMWGWCPA